MNFRKRIKNRQFRIHVYISAILITYIGLVHRATQYKRPGAGVYKIQEMPVNDFLGAVLVCIFIATLIPFGFHLVTNTSEAFFEKSLRYTTIVLCFSMILIAVFVVPNGKTVITM